MFRFNILQIMSKKGSSWHNIKDPARILPPDAQGRLRNIDSEGFIVVHLPLDHPLANNCRHVREHRLVMYESERLLPGQRVYFKDGNRQNTSLDNLVAADMGDCMPTTVMERPCLCGCGQMVHRVRPGNLNKYVKGHYKRLKRDQFHDLPVTRQRQTQLRNVANGLCSMCKRPRDGHPRLCPVHMARETIGRNSRRRAWEKKYLKGGRDLPPVKVIFPPKVGDRTEEYLAIRSQLGNKRDWPVELRREWNLRHPTAGQKRLLDLGIRYDRM